MSTTTESAERLVPRGLPRLFPSATRLPLERVQGVPSVPVSPAAHLS